MIKFLIILAFAFSCFANPTVQIVTRDGKISGKITEVKQHELTLKNWNDCLFGRFIKISYADIDTINYQNKIFLTFPITDSNVNLFLKRCPQDINSNKNTGTNTFLGVLTIAAGTLAGIITIVDATSSTSAGPVTVQNQWTRFHTICISLSIGTITSGIAILSH